MTTIPILGVNITSQRYAEAMERLLVAARDAATTRVHFCTVHTLVEASANPSLRNVLNSADMVAMDGVPLVWVARRRGLKRVERVCGPDVMSSLSDQGRALGLRHYFLGGRTGVPEALAQRLRVRFPGLVVVGAESPPFRALTAEEDESLISRINAAAPDVLWIGLGSPKQEFWASNHERNLSVPLILPVGAAFDFHSGRLRRAPRWMQKTGLEWLFRLAAEPRRLIKRYAVTNVLFVYLILKEEIKRRGAS